MAKLPKNMDLQELMAHDLEFRQQQRYRQAKNKDTFFEREIEQKIQKQIVFMRSVSGTYDPTRGKYYSAKVDRSHPCEMEHCTRTVEFDDWAFCFEHCPESGNVAGYSYKKKHSVRG